MICLKNENNIKVTKEKRDDMVRAIKSFFLTEREEELGDLAAGLILDFIIEELAPEFYNQGVLILINTCRTRLKIYYQSKNYDTR